VEARDTWGRIVAALFLVGLLLFTALVGQGFFNGTDFGAWEGDWSKFIACLTEGGCGALTFFPVGYLINSAIVQGFSTIIAPVVVLWTLNFALLLLPVAAGYLLRFPGATDRATVYALGLVLSPIPAYYLWSAALEFQAGILAGMLVVLAARCLRVEGGADGSSPGIRAENTKTTNRQTIDGTIRRSPQAPQPNGAHQREKARSDSTALPMATATA